MEKSIGTELRRQASSITYKSKKKLKSELQQRGVAVTFEVKFY